jgi:hypothetical protein
MPTNNINLPPQGAAGVTSATPTKPKKIVIYAGMKSANWESEVDQLAGILTRDGYNILGIIPISELRRPQIEYLQ